MDILKNICVSATQIGFLVFLDNWRADRDLGLHPTQRSSVPGAHSIAYILVAQK